MIKFPNVKETYCNLTNKVNKQDFVALLFDSIIKIVGNNLPWLY